MKPGRNDPCPCGSGKKYKKCCLEKDEAAARAERLAALPPDAVPPASLPPRTPPPAASLDPRIAAIDARWEQFEEGEYEDRIALFAVTLGEPDLMDGEMAFEMLAELNDEMVKRGERRRLDDLVEALRRRLPDVYAEEAPHFLSWRIANAIADGRMEDLPALTREMATFAAAEIDLFNEVADRLAYHGQTGLLRAMMEAAWPEVRNSDQIVPWGIQEFGWRLAYLILFEALERGEEPVIGNADLVRRMQSYADIVPDVLDRYLLHLTGQSDRQWTPEDFRLTRRPRRSRRELDDWEEDEDEEGAGRREGAEDPARENLFYLSGGFLGYLRREEDIPYTKGELAREEIIQYIVRRFDGELAPQQSPLDAAMGRKKPKAKPVPREPPGLLCPDAKTFDRHLGELIGIFSNRLHRAAAAFELTPAWLRFLESRGLISAERRQQTLRDLERVATGLRDLWVLEKGDPALLRGIERWAADAGLEG